MVRWEFAWCDSSGYFTFGRTSYGKYPGRTTVTMPDYMSREDVTTVKMVFKVECRAK